MTTVLPQNTGAIEATGIPLAVMIAIGAVALASACLWGWDCWRSFNRAATKSEPCAEDKALDALGAEVDRRLEEQDRRQRRRAVPITDPTLDPIQIMNINRAGRRRAMDGGGWPT